MMNYVSISVTALSLCVLIMNYVIALGSQTHDRASVQVERSRYGAALYNLVLATVGIQSIDGSQENLLMSAYTHTHL